MSIHEDPKTAELGSEVRTDWDSSQLVDENHNQKVPGFLLAIIVASVVSSTFLYALDNTIMANVRPGIINTFGHIDMLPWLSVSYPMGEVGSSLLWGAMYRQFNNKWLFCIDVVIFEGGSAIIGSAQNIESLIAGRVIAGMGGSGIYIGTVNIISEMTVPSKRAQYLSYIGIAWSLGTILGPIVGGAFNDSSATWRWAFYINLCICGLAAPVCLFLIPSFAPKSQYKSYHRLKQVDYLGATLFAGGVATIIMVLGFGGSVWSWDDHRMIGLYVSTCLSWTAFIIQQGYSLLASDRIFPMDLVARWDMCILFAHSSIAIANIVITIYMVPLLFQFVYGDSALRSGLFLLAISAAAVVAAGAGGAILPKFPMYMPWFIVACTLMLCGSGLLTTIRSHTPQGTVCAYAAVQLLGCGLVVQLPFTVAQVKVEKERARSVNAFLTCAQMAGVALSIGIATCVFVNRTTFDISKILPNLARETVQAGIEGAGASLVGSLSDIDRARVLGIIAVNIAKVFYMNVAGAALGLCISLFMKCDRLQL